MWKAFFKALCPRCRRGPMFKNGLGSYPFIGRMHENCPHCGLHFEREPGFWTGAMYTGYAFSVATVVACGVAVYVLGHNPDTWVYIVTTVVGALLVAPLNFRYSRVMMLYWFGGVDYDPAAEAGKVHRA